MNGIYTGRNNNEAHTANHQDQSVSAAQEHAYWTTEECQGTADNADASQDYLQKFPAKTLDLLA